MQHGVTYCLHYPRAKKQCAECPKGKACGVMSDYGPLLIILMIIIKATVRTGQVVVRRQRNTLIKMTQRMQKQASQMRMQEDPYTRPGIRLSCTLSASV